MPSVTTKACARILERLELQTFSRDANRRSKGKEARLVGGDEMRHRAALPQMAVKPQTAIHCANHPIAPTFELPIRRIVKRIAY
jgi:hypothetical protein